MRNNLVSKGSKSLLTPTSFYGNGSYQYVLDLTEDGFTAEKVTIVIKAEGYKDLTYIANIDEVYQLKDAPTFEGETDGVINVIEGENLTVNISDTAYLQNAKVTTG